MRQIEAGLVRKGFKKKLRAPGPAVHVGEYVTKETSRAIKQVILEI